MIRINTFIQSRNELLTNYSFIITKIDVTPTSSLNFYNDEKEIQLWNYTIMDNEGVEKGDYLYKKTKSKYLYIYKKDKITGKYKIHLKKQPTSLFPHYWYYDERN